MITTLLLYRIGSKGSRMNLFLLGLSWEMESQNTVSLSHSEKWAVGLLLLWWISSFPIQPLSPVLSHVMLTPDIQKNLNKLFLIIIFRYELLPVRWSFGLASFNHHLLCTSTPCPFTWLPSTGVLVGELGGGRQPPQIKLNHDLFSQVMYKCSWYHIIFNKMLVSPLILANWPIPK